MKDGFITVACGTPKLRLADCDYNAEQTFTLMRKAEKAGAKVLVLPDADVKIFLCADVETRARRRCLELEQRGTPKPFDEVLREMEQRDYNDTHRAAAPLRPADDAIMIDNTDMDFAASLELLLDVIRGSVEQ